MRMQYVDEQDTEQAWVKEHFKGHSFTLLSFLLVYLSHTCSCG